MLPYIKNDTYLLAYMQCIFSFYQEIAGLCMYFLPVDSKTQKKI